MKVYKLVQELTDAIRAENPNIPLEACYMIANYKLSVLVGNLRVKVNISDGKNPAPINFYGLLLLNSGGGKNSSLETLDEWYFKDVYSRLQKVFMSRVASYLSVFNDKDAEIEKATLGMWKPTIGSATEAAMLQLAQTLHKVEFGTPSFEVDEIDKFIATKEEMINNLYGSYDNGNWATKAIKSETTQSQVTGVAPNFFSFGTYEALMLNDNIADVFRDKLQSGLARRSFFYHEDSDRLPVVITAQERFEMNKKSKVMRESASATAKYLLDLVKPENEGKVLEFEDDAFMRYLEFRSYSEGMGNIVKDPIMMAEYNGRHFKTAKLAGMYAFLDGRDKINVSDVEYAISIAEFSTSSLTRVIQGKTKLERLYMRMRSENRFVDTNEALEYGIYPANQVKAIKVHFKELEDLSYKYGDTYECMEIGTMLSVKITQLISTSEDSCILSYSLPIGGKPNHANNYVKKELSFDEIPNYITQSNVCYSPIAFKGGNRNNESTEPYSNLIILDVDDGMSIDYAKELFADTYAIIAPTRNHLKEKNGVINDRFRIILLADKYINTTPDIYKEFMKNIAKYYSVVIDDKCFDKAHIYYGNPTDEIWFGSCEKKFEVAKLVPKEKKENKKAITPFVPTSGTPLRAYFEQEVRKIAVSGTGGISLLTKAALACEDKLNMSYDEAYEWLYSLHDTIESIDHSYFNRHNFEKEVMGILDKSYK